MHPFTFQYKGETKKSFAIKLYNAGSLFFKVEWEEKYWFTIMPAGFTEVENNILWIQPIAPGEIVQPKDLVQAVGEGIEKAEI